MDDRFGLDDWDRYAVALAAWRLRVARDKAAARRAARMAADAARATGRIAVFAAA
jgi:hypothetical protein